MRAHRGSVAADFDNDGRLDVAVAALGANAELWRNTTAAAGNWVSVILEGKRSNRDGIGARVQLGRQTAWMQTAASYSSSSHAGLHFGLGSETVGKVTITWPSGAVQVVDGVKAGQILRVTEP